MIVSCVVTQLGFERAHTCIRINNNCFNTCHFCVINNFICSYTLSVGAMVRAAYELTSNADQAEEFEHLGRFLFRQQVDLELEMPPVIGLATLSVLGH